MEVTERVSNITKNVPHILKNVNTPIYKMSSTEPLDEAEILIKHGMLVEDFFY